MLFYILSFFLSFLPFPYESYYFFFLYHTFASLSLTTSNIFELVSDKLMTAMVPTKVPISYQCNAKSRFMKSWNNTQSRFIRFNVADSDCHVSVATPDNLFCQFTIHDSTIKVIKHGTLWHLNNIHCDIIDKFRHLDENIYSHDNKFGFNDPICLKTHFFQD